MEQHGGTKLKPAPLKFPHGGGLAAMATAPKSQKLEMEALQKKHEVEMQKLKEKHAAVNKPAKAKTNG
jgi:hypothetical protein